MGKVIELNRKRIFTLSEARELLPVIRHITDDANQKVKALMVTLDGIREKSSDRARDLEDKINTVVQEWQLKIEKLGADGKGLWLVDFDNGTGYFCWKYPEDRLDHFHSYTEGFQGRVRIDKDPTPTLRHTIQDL